jgi:hypothetical protein
VGSFEVRIARDTATPLLQRIREFLRLSTQARLRVGARAEYASYVEFGTSRMAARPFIRPAVDYNARDIARAFMEGIMHGQVLFQLEVAGGNIEELARSLAPVRTGKLRASIYHEVG